MKDALFCAVANTYSEVQAQFDETAFMEHWHTDFLIVLGFIQRHLLRELTIVNGDPVLGLVISEIWLYNITRTLSRDGEIPSSKVLCDDTRRNRFATCNTYSVAQSLGVPAQTVRRKVQILVDKGWVEKTPKGQLLVTASCEDAFHRHTTLETMRDFISSARTLFAHLDLDPLLQKAPDKMASADRRNK